MQPHHAIYFFFFFFFPFYRKEQLEAAARYISDYEVPPFTVVFREGSVLHGGKLLDSHVGYKLVFGAHSVAEH